MKQTNKKEFSKFLNKFEKLLDYHVNVLGTGVELDPFNNNTEKFLKTSHCRFILYTESGKIYLKMSFFDKNKDEVFSEGLNDSRTFEYLNLKGDNSDIAVSSPIDLSGVSMGRYNFFKNEVNGADNYKVYKDFVRVAITNFDFLYNNLNSSFVPEKSTDCYLNAFNKLLDILVQGNKYSPYGKCYLHILQSIDERKNLFGSSDFFISKSGEELRDTFRFIVRKIELSILESDKTNKDDVFSLLNVVNVYATRDGYDEFCKKLNLLCVFIKKLNQTSKFKLEEAKHYSVYKFVRDITMNKSNDLIAHTLLKDKIFDSGAIYDSELKVSDLKSIFRLVAKK